MARSPAADHTGSMPRAIGLRFVAPLVALAASAVGCSNDLEPAAEYYVRPRSYVRVTAPCPSLKRGDDDRFERSARPDVNAIWVSGHWDWKHGWKWVRGEWQIPRPGYEWEPPVCTVVAGEFRLYPGYFRGREEEPPPVYREPGHIRMHRASDLDPRLPPRIEQEPGEPLPRDTGPTSPDVRYAREQPEDDARGAQEGREGTAGHASEPEPRAEERRDPSNHRGEAPPRAVPPGEPDLAHGSRESSSDAGSARAGDGAAPGRAELSCAIRTTRIPIDGALEIRGTGFDPDIAVTIAGSFAEVRRRTPTKITARANRGGEVRVVRGDEDVRCGHITVVR